jgi:hypothetical protein
MPEEKPESRRPVFIAILLIFFFALGFSLSINLPVIHDNFLFADQAVYYALTQSIAHDGDLEYTKKDLIRYYHDFAAGPQGIFLKKVKTGKIYYAKSWAYPLFAAPFVRVFGANGFFVFHSFLLLLILLMGRSYLASANGPIRSLFYVLSFLFASVAAVYFLWISPDFFNFCLVFAVLFLWVYKIRRGERAAGDPAGCPGPPSFLGSPRTDYLAAFLAGIAVFSKPPNIVLMGPLVFYALFQKKIGKALLLGSIFLLTLILLFGTNYLLTSEWNYQGGERKSFIGAFPLEKDSATFDSLGDVMTSENYFQRFLLPPKFILYNIYYYCFGRFTGIAWYFFPALLALGLFFTTRRRFPDWLVLAALAAGILIYIVLMPDNYGGGGGTLANRYFLNIYPFFFFLPGVKKGWRQIVLIWMMAALFISPILVSPFRSSAQPATHAKRFPFKALPVEMTQVNNFPTNTNPDAFRVHIWPEKPQPQREFIHFLDDNFYKKLEPTGIWTRGDKTCELILKTYYPLREIGVRLLNNPRANNRISVRVEGKTRKIVLQPRQRGTLRFSVGNGFRVESRYHYRIKIRAEKGSIPYYEDPSSLERRYLGVFFELELVPK